MNNQLNTNQIVNTYVLNLFDQDIPVHEFASGRVRFGLDNAIGRATFRTHSQVIGLFSAIAGLKLDHYPVHKPGCHLKRDFTEFRLTYNMPGDYDNNPVFVGYVHFGTLKELEDAETMALLAKHGIVPNDEYPDRWLALRLKNGKVYVHHPVNPKNQDEFKEMILAEYDHEATPYNVQNNKRDWAVYNKHEAMDLALRLLDGTIHLDVQPIMDKAGFEHQSTIRRVRFESLFGQRETLDEVVKEGVRQGREHARQAIASGRLRQTPSNMLTLTAQLGIKQGTAEVFHNDEMTNATYEQIMGRTVALRTGTVNKGRFFLQDDAAILALQAQAQRIGAVIALIG